MYICKFCGSERKNKNSLMNHERLCSLNPNRQSTPFMDGKQKGHRGMNQFSKAKELGLPKPIVSEETREKLSNNIKSRTPEFRKKVGETISKTIQKKVSGGKWHTSLAKHMHIEYKGVDLHGTWELKYVEYLESKNIKWIRNKDSFSYFFDGKERKYTPDFYLPETDEYIEVKGYKRPKDEEKWSQFPTHRKLTVLMKGELVSLGINIS